MSNKIFAGKADSNTVRIGVHVRAEHDNDAPEHFFCLDSLVEKYRQGGKNVKILLVTASVALQNYALQKYSNLLLLPNGKPDGIVAVHDRDDSHTDKQKNVTDEGTSRIEISGGPTQRIFHRMHETNQKRSDGDAQFSQRYASVIPDGCAYYQPSKRFRGSISFNETKVCDISALKRH
jgi:hypothetical protein